MTAMPLTSLSREKPNSPLPDTNPPTSDGSEKVASKSQRQRLNHMPRLELRNRKGVDKAGNARVRIGLDREAKQLPSITSILRAAEGGLKGCIKALRGDDDPDSLLFIAKYDSISSDDKRHLSVEEIAASVELTPRRLVGLVASALASQGEQATSIIVSSAKAKIVQATVDMALLPEGTKEKEMFHKHTRWLPEAKGLAVNVDNRTQNNTLNAGDSERALPPPKADAFMLEMQATFRPDQRMIEAPEPDVEANVPELEYMEADL